MHAQLVHDRRAQLDALHRPLIHDQLARIRVGRLVQHFGRAGGDGQAFAQMEAVLILARLPQKLKDLKVDGVICGMAC